MVKIVLFASEIVHNLGWPLNHHKPSTIMLAEPLFRIRVIPLKHKQGGWKRFSIPTS